MNSLKWSESRRESFREARKDSGPIPDKQGQTKVIVDAITEEGIPFGSILVARHWQEGKRAVFFYLLTTNVAKVKRKLQRMGFTLLNPMGWSIDEQKRDLTK